MFRSEILRVPLGFIIVLILWAGSANAQVISFNPVDNVPTDPVFDVHLDIDCGVEDVKGIELKVAFDPFLVRLDGISAGNWYADSGQDHYFYDYTNVDPQGVIHFASAVLDGTLSGTGNLAVCHFTILGFGISPLIFQDTDVRGLENLDLGFGHSTGDRIILDPVVEVHERAFGTIKAIYR